MYYNTKFWRTYRYRLSVSPKPKAQGSHLMKIGFVRLAQLPCTNETEQERPSRIADRHVMIVTSKMSCARKTRESCERLSPK